MKNRTRGAQKRAENKLPDTQHTVAATCIAVLEYRALRNRLTLQCASLIQIGSGVWEREQEDWESLSRLNRFDLLCTVINA